MNRFDKVIAISNYQKEFDFIHHDKYHFVYHDHHKNPRFSCWETKNVLADIKPAHLEIIDNCLIDIDKGSFQKETIEDMKKELLKWLKG